MGIQNSMTIDAYKLLVAALLLIKQHVCMHRAPDGHCLWQLQCRPGSSAGKPTRQGVSTSDALIRHFPKSDTAIRVSDTQIRGYAVSLHEIRQ